MQDRSLRRACLLLCLIPGLVAGACSREAGSPAARSAPDRAPQLADASAPRTAATNGFPRDVLLPDGSTFHAAAPAARIVPASATAVDFVAALVAPERVAGLPEQALEYSRLHDDALWRGHARFRAYLAEPVLMLRPDLVICDPWQARDTQERLREAGVSVLSLDEIETWADARATLLALGEVLGAEERAREVTADLDRRVEALRARGAARGVRLRVMCYSNFGSAGWTAGSRTTVDEMIRLAGMENLVAAAGREGHCQVTFEDLLVFDPDVIVVSQPLKQESGHAGDRGGASERLLLSEASLADLRAVRERRIVSLPAWLFAAGSHELVSGAEALADEVDELLRRLAAEGRR